MPDLHHLYCSSNLLCCNGLFVELTNLREFLWGTRRTLKLQRSHSLYHSCPPACQWFIAGLVAPGSTFQGRCNLNSLAYCLPSSWAANTCFWRSLLRRMTCNYFHKALWKILSGELKNTGTTLHCTVALTTQAYRKAWDSISAVNELFFLKLTRDFCSHNVNEVT